MNEIIDGSNSLPSESGKTRAIIAHITLIGWIIAVVQNNNDEKDEFASFYIRQMLGLVLIGILSIIPFIGLIFSLAALILWILSIIGAVNGEKKLTPIVGEMFQDWFKNL